MQPKYYDSTRGFFKNIKTKHIVVPAHSQKRELRGYNNNTFYQNTVVKDIIIIIHRKVKTIYQISTPECRPMMTDVWYTIPYYSRLLLLFFSSLFFQPLPLLKYSVKVVILACKNELPFLCQRPMTLDMLCSAQQS